MYTADTVTIRLIPPSGKSRIRTKGFKVLLSFLSLGARRQSSIHAVREKQPMDGVLAHATVV